ncbi:hypothetical protein NE562_15670, partial [Butyricicoccus faecihominis]|uniref:hypothetical protein n=1 Tax=Butyricicoccus faecihominis TaxID=1712515 RepID=UPI0024795F37
MIHFSFYNRPRIEILKETANWNRSPSMWGIQEDWLRGGVDAPQPKMKGAFSAEPFLQLGDIEVVPIDKIAAV